VQIEQVQMKIMKGRPYLTVGSKERMRDGDLVDDEKFGK
jgi:hypothetical protein